MGVAVDGDDNVIVADTWNQGIRKITPQGHVSTLAGTGEKGNRDGEGAVAQFNFPCGVAVDGDGNGIVADTVNQRIRKVTPQGHVSTLAGTGEEGHQDGDRQPRLGSVSRAESQWMRKGTLLWLTQKVIASAVWPLMV
jgi:DNA-binding beta-propeller fold protein YncE